MTEPPITQDILIATINRFIRLAMLEYSQYVSLNAPSLGENTKTYGQWLLDEGGYIQYNIEKLSAKLKF